jgi:outer membrane protein insertion porin family/translocation and assembly module TamA
MRAVPAVTVYTERVSEYKAYLRTTAIGGVASVLWQQWRTVPLTFSYAMDYGRTEAQPALFCAVFNVCDAETRERFQATQRLAVVSAAIARDNTNSLVSPSRGSVARFEVRHASPAVFSDKTLQFNKLQGEVASYIGVGPNVFALRLRSGAVFGRTLGSAIGFIPPQERLYAGGATTVRGFNQNELGAALYIAAGIDTVVQNGDTLFRADSSAGIRRTVPLGGNTLVVGNAELRLRSPILPELLQWTVFTDAGEVWNRELANVFDNFSIKITPGIQLAAFTPVGPVRAVLGYNPYRKPTGPLYYESRRQEGGGLPCVSPGNTLPVHTQSTAEGEVLVQAEGRCPSTFRPPAEGNFRSRLILTLAIGQAF